MSQRLDSALWTEVIDGQEATMLGAEALRARAEEARLTAEVAEKDSTIKNLADALLAHGGVVVAGHGKAYHVDVQILLRRPGVLK